MEDEWVQAGACACKQEIKRPAYIKVFALKNGSIRRCYRHESTHSYASYVARGPNLFVRWPCNRARKVEFYWSSSLEIPLKRHVYLVSRNISAEPTPSSLKTAAFLHAQILVLPPLPSKSSLNSTQIFPSRRKPEQIERWKLHPAKQNRIGAASHAAMGIPLRSLLVASLVLSSVVLHVAAAKTIDPYKASNFWVLLLRIPCFVVNSRHFFN